MADTTDWALGERIKELTCLYGTAKLAAAPGLPLDAFLRGVVGLLPPAWQHPDVTTARITVDALSVATPGFREGPARQAADIVAGGATRGTVEVFYVATRPDFDEGPFLKEERSLIDAVAQQIAVVIERDALQDQLRHADRLATLGRLTAGVAHELNEPLANVLGFAQLAQKTPGLPAQAAADLDRIVKTALYARETIRKLMFYARQMPPKRTPIHLNALVEEGLSLIAPKAGITITRELATGLPTVPGDAAQLHQVLVNLVANAIQAMPEGGTVTVSTRAEGDVVVLAVRDTGTGMTDEVKRRIFEPFFTTKDVGKGTGLGLAVVQGIVAGHNGRIDVHSTPGKGSEFRVFLPATTETPNTTDPQTKHKPE